MTTRGQDIVSVIKQQIEQFGTTAAMVDVGSVVEVGERGRVVRADADV